MNILFSSTTAWNPGDDFIRMGCIVALERAIPGPHHYSVYPRNHTICRESRALEESNQQANVFCDLDTIEGYDLVVIAGTPDWGQANRSLYVRAREAGIPIMFLGIGSESLEHTSRHCDPETRQALARAILVTCRDEITGQFLTSLDQPHTALPCPAALAALSVDYVSPRRKLVIVTSDVQRIQDAALLIYRENPTATLICHSAYERNWLVRAGYRPVYDHDPARLLRAILHHDRMISGRLHAAIPFLAAGFREVELVPGCSPRIQQGLDSLRNHHGGAERIANLYRDLIVSAVNAERSEPEPTQPQ